MNELTLVIMAAGMGSRFGGLKQITSIDQEGNFLIDYSVYDAIKAGFNKVIFIIKEENLEIFKKTIGNRIENKIKVEYAFQKIEDVKCSIKIPETRRKPWGTVHALLSAKEKINGPFGVINADDFYGFDSFKIIVDFLNSNTKETEHLIIPYPFNKVSSKYGSVKRGVLFYDKDNVSYIKECQVEYNGNKIIASPLDESASIIIQEDHPVSMNMFGFQKSILNELEEYFQNFMIKNQNDLEKCECLISDFLEEYLKKEKITLKYVTSNGVWLGMTYQEDLKEVQKKLTELKASGEYPISLWQK